MPCHSEVIDRWAAQADGPPEHRSMRGSRIFARGMTIYSYGTHFPMAIINHARRGYPPFVLVNGDTFSSTTTGHQRMVRGSVRGWDELIVPFSALDGAGIIRDTIRPIQILPDTHAESRQNWTLAEMRRAAENDYSGVRVAGSGFEQNLKRDYHAPDDWQPVEMIAGSYVRITWRHYLGEAIFSARTAAGRGGRVGPRVKFLSAFDHDEKRWTRDQSYFLAMLPQSDAVTVAEAFETLAPPIVKRARGMELPVKRQGDLYAIPCELPPEMTHPAPWKRGTAVYEYLPFVAPRIVLDSVRVGNYSHNRFPRQWAGLRDSYGTVRGYDRGTRQFLRDDVPDIPRFTPTRFPYWRLKEHRSNRLLGTDHTATETIIPETGETYARGIMRHETGGRDKDHADVRLGNQWHLIVRNTVPRQRI